MIFENYIIKFEDPMGEQVYSYSLIISIYRSLNARFPITRIYLDKYNYKNAILQCGEDHHDSQSEGVIELINLISDF